MHLSLRIGYNRRTLKNNYTKSDKNSMHKKNNNKK